MINTTKRCKTCGQNKSIDQFWTNPKTKDKLKTSCITCSKKYNKSHYQQNRKERIKQVIAYHKSQINTYNKTQPT